MAFKRTTIEPLASLSEQVSTLKPELIPRSSFQQKVSKAPAVEAAKLISYATQQAFFNSELKQREREAGRQETGRAEAGPAERDERKEREQQMGPLYSPEEIVERTQEIIDSSEDVREIIDIVRVVNRKGVAKETIVSRVKEIVSKEGKRIEQEVPKQRMVELEKSAERIFTKHSEMTKKELVKEIKRIAAAVPADIGSKLKKATEDLSERDKEYLVDQLKRLADRKDQYSEMKKELLKVLDKAVKDSAFSKEQILKELQKLAERSKTELGQDLSKVLAEGEKAEAKLEEIVGSVSRLISSYGRRVETAEAVDSIVKKSDTLSKGQIVEGLRKIVEDWQARTKFVDAAVQMAEKLLLKRPKLDEFAKKIVGVVQSAVKQYPRFFELAESLVKTVEDRKAAGASPSQITDELRSISDGMESNPYVRRIREIVGQSKRLEKKDVVQQLQRLRDEMKESQWVVQKLGRLIRGPESADKQKLLYELRNLYWAVSSDRLGKGILEIIRNEKQYGLTREQLVGGLSKLLRQEERVGQMLSVINVSVEKRSAADLNRVSNVLGTALNELRGVNGVARRLSSEAAVKGMGAEGPDAEAKEKMYAVVDEFSKMIAGMEKNGRKEAGKAFVREEFEKYRSKETGPKALAVQLDEIFDGGDISWRIEALRGMERLVKERNVAGLEPKLLEYAKKGALSADLEFKTLAFMTLGRYADYVSDLHTQDAAKVHDEIGKIILEGASKGNYRVVSEALKTADKVAGNSKAAVSFIKMWCGSAAMTPARALARKMAKEHGIPFS